VKDGEEKEGRREEKKGREGCMWELGLRVSRG